MIGASIVVDKFQDTGRMFVQIMNKLYKSRAFMYRRYVVQKRTEQEIAEELNVDQATINRWLRKHELKK